MQGNRLYNQNIAACVLNTPTVTSVKALGRLLFAMVVLTLGFSNAAKASLSCQLIFSKKPTTAVWKPTDPLQFGEIITPLNQLKSLDQATQVIKDPASKLWRVRAEANSVPKFSLELAEPLKTSEQQQQGPLFDYVKFTEIKYFAHQDVGNGLVLDLKSNQNEFRLRLRLEGNSNDKGDRYSAVADIDVTNSNQLIKIPWNKFFMENTISETPTALLDFKSEYIENFHGPGMHITRVTNAPLDQPYLIKAGDVFEPALLDIRRLSFEVLPLDSSRPLELIMGESLHRDFSLDYLTKNRTYLELALQMMLPMQGGKDFLEHALKKYKDPSAIQFALNTINQGPEKLRDVLESYGFKMVQVPDQKISADEFFSKYLGNGLIPIEQGAFAKHHGRFTHVAQVLTLLHGSFTTTEANMASNSTNVGDKNVHRAQYVRQVMDGMRPNSGPKFLWRNVWNIFFDAPGAEGPNTPLWWVDQFKKYKIVNEPSATP